MSYKRTLLIDLEEVLKRAGKGKNSKCKQPTGVNSGLP